MIIKKYMQVELYGSQKLVDYELFDTEEKALGCYDGNFRVVPVDLVFSDDALSPLSNDARLTEIARIKSMWRGSENYKRTSCEYLSKQDDAAQ